MKLVKYSITMQWNIIQHVNSCFQDYLTLCGGGNKMSSHEIANIYAQHRQKFKKQMKMSVVVTSSLVPGLVGKFYTLVFSKFSQWKSTKQQNLHQSGCSSERGGSSLHSTFEGFLIQGRRGSHVCWEGWGATAGRCHQKLQPAAPPRGLPRAH